MIQLIKAATLSTNNEARSQAEQQLKKTRIQNTQEFFLQVAKVFSSDQVDPRIRQSAGVILNISTPTIAGERTLWDRLEAGTKQFIKQKVLGNMIDQDSGVRRAAANVVAAICCVELPRGEWKNIISILVNNMKHEKNQVRGVSIMTLGFICERLKQKEYSFEKQIQEKFITAVLIGAKDTVSQNKMFALKAFRDSLFSMNTIMQNQQYRDFIVKNIVELLNETDKVMPLQILSQFAKNYYPLLGSYIQGLYTITQPIIANSSADDNCCMAMQFWQTVADEYKNRQEDGETVQKYITGELGIKIVASLLKNLCMIQGQNQDDENLVFESAQRALSTICQCGSGQFEHSFVEFISGTLRHDDWKFKQASVKAFSILLYGFDQDKAATMVTNSITDFLPLLNEKSKKVRFSCIESLNLITELAGSAILKHPSFLQILKLIVDKLGISEQYVKHIAKIISNLCNAAQANKLPNFTGIAGDLIGVMIQKCLTVDSSIQSLNYSMGAIMDLISVAKNSDLCYRQINFVLQNFQKLGSLTGEKKRAIQGGFLIIVQTSLISLMNEKVNIDPEMLQKVYNLVIEYFARINDVNDDGIYVIGALVPFLPNNTQVVDKIWPYIEHAIGKYRQGQLFKATLSCITALVHRYRQNMANRLSFINNFIVLLNDNQFDRNLKIQILQCLGDIVLACGRVVMPYLDKIMEVITCFFEAAIQMTKIEFNFAESIKNCVIDTLFCIFHGLCQQNNQCSELRKFFPPIFKFIQVSVSKDSRPTVEFIKKCMILVADARNFYKKGIDQYTNKKYVFESIQHLKKYNKNNRYTENIDYIKSSF